MIKKLYEWLKSLFNPIKRKKDMAYGLEVRDSAGGVILDQLTTCGHIYKSVTVPAGSGNWSYYDSVITADMVAVFQMMWSVSTYRIDHPAPFYAEVSNGVLKIVRTIDTPTFVVHILRVK